FWPVERVEILKVTKEQNVTFGDRGGDDGRMLAGDQNMVDIRFTVQWRIADAKKFLFNIREPEALIRVISESAMRDVVGRTAADEVRTKGRFATQEQVKELIQKTLTSYDAGININGVQLEQADPPPEVVDAFEEVQRAEQEQNKLIREAERYRNKLLGEARGEAAQIVEKAKAYKSRVVAESEGEAARFIKIYDEYAKAKDVTRKRLFLETMEEVLAKSNKVIIEGKGGSGVVPYLPLPEIAKQRNPGGN
ncbi:HflK protein, partial [hydrothermal vent metagenome]